MIICKIFGHKWDESKNISEHPEQNCTRKNCTAFRTLTFKKFPHIGEAAYDWKIFD